MVQLNAHDEFKIFAAFLLYRLESKQAQQWAVQAWNSSEEPSAEDEGD